MEMIAQQSTDNKLSGRRGWQRFLVAAPQNQILGGEREYYPSYADERDTRVIFSSPCVWPCLSGRARVILEEFRRRPDPRAKKRVDRPKPIDCEAKKQSLLNPGDRRHRLPPPKWRHPNFGAALAAITGANFLCTLSGEIGAPQLTTESFADFR